MIKNQSLASSNHDPPDSGVVLIDGVDITKLQLKWLRQNIGLVDQEHVLFTTTIKENLAHGKENATDEEIRRATELANAAKFIDKLLEGLDAMVGSNGSQLYSGQKQRIAIAMAILKNPKILLLDEVTSALDAESKRIVSDALENVMTNRTTVAVAHRLTIVRNADIIAVVDKGKLVEQDKSNASSSQMDEAMARPRRRRPRRVIDGVILPIFALILSTAIKMFFKPPHQLQKVSKMCGAIVARLSTDALAIKSLVGDVLALIVQNIATMTAGLVIAFTAN
ncbi:hypothetical protein EZV62_027090 [Acer yangbiense]|uniref:ABC transporter domain-containing protein n=1 Tax=Acer yangbiense TaxID=1000413 RepID=A0A5C7GUK7_9ROSI|nr:hypothetical protein EZV62_027090 [Acer yangbiense]